MATRIIDIIVVSIFGFFAFVVANLPERLGLLVCDRLIRFFIFVIPRYRKTALRNLELIFPEKDINARKGIYEKSLLVLSKNLYMFCITKKLKEQDIINLIDYSKGVECLIRLRRENPGVGILLPNLHFGSFEISIHFKVLFDKTTNVLVRSFGLPIFDSWWNKRREKFGSKVFWRKGGFSEMVRYLKNGEDVAILADQNVKRNHAIFVPFFGIMAATTRSIGLAVLKTECPVVVSGVIEVSPNKYELYFEELNTYKNSNLTNEERIEKITLELNRASENLIRRSPENWFWIHRRFKTRPNPEDKSLYE